METDSFKKKNIDTKSLSQVKKMYNCCMQKINSRIDKQDNKTLQNKKNYEEEQIQAQQCAHI